MLKIRLSRVGKKNKPHYRVVVCEHTKPIKGKFIEIVGSYDPHQEKEKGLVIKRDRIDYWVSNGAQMSDTVASLVSPSADKKAKVKNEKKEEKKVEGENNKKKEAQKKADKTENKKAKQEDKTKDEVKDKSAK